jgi:hypothetical protein
MEEMAKELEILKADRDKLATQKRDLQQAAATRGTALSLCGFLYLFSFSFVCFDTIVIHHGLI